MGGKEKDTIELPADKICVIKHEENISRIKKNKSLMVLNKEERDGLKERKQRGFIFDVQGMYEILREFSINKEDID